MNSSLFHHGLMPLREWYCTLIFTAL